MALRESGLGWGEVAHALGISLGAAVGGQKSPTVHKPSPPAKPPPTLPPGRGRKKPR